MVHELIITPMFKCRILSFVSLSFSFLKTFYLGLQLLIRKWQILTYPNKGWTMLYLVTKTEYTSPPPFWSFSSISSVNLLWLFFTGDEGNSFVEKMSGPIVLITFFNPNKRFLYFWYVGIFKGPSSHDLLLGNLFSLLGWVFVSLIS